MTISWKKYFSVFLLSFSMCFSVNVFMPHPGQAQIVIPSYNPTDDDNNEQNKTITISGGTDTVTAADLSSTFVSGYNPAPTATALNDLQTAGKVTAPAGLLGQHTLTLGSQNFAIAVPDSITGTSSTMSVYDTNKIDLSAQTIGDRTVNVYDNVGDQQYINLTIAEIDSGGGTMDVALGTAGNDKASSTNHLNLAAKQSTFFKADGTSNAAEINWNSNNRVTFFGVALNPSGKTTYNAQGVATFGGTFAFTTKAGVSYTKTVTDEASLRDYNDWLIDELKLGNLQGDEYAGLFAKAVVMADKSLTYQQPATAPDEIFQPVGERVIIQATGENAVTNINAKLEGQNATTAVKLNDGAKMVISNVGSLGNTNGAVVAMTGNSSTENNGVINVNFLTDAVGGRESGGVNNVHGILVNDTSSFVNNSILNVETNGGSGNTIGLVLNNSAAAAAGSGYQGTDNNYYSAGNSSVGIMNIGVSSKSSSGSTIGVLVDSTNSSFINEGEIYLGRSNQNSGNDLTTDQTINQKKFLSGIVVKDNGKAINNGNIFIESGVQNGVGMLADTGDDTVMTNRHYITLHDNSALTVPNANYAMLVQNAGKNGGITHEGTIELEGINGIGLKVLSTGNYSASASTIAGSLIDINGAADPTSGTRNYGVWVEGQGSQKATATLDGAIKLVGDGAIGIHARGNATVDVGDDAIPQLIGGEKQIGFFAYGDGAKINLTGGTAAFEVVTKESTMFRLENGADMFYNSNLAITTSGAGSKGIVGTGARTVLDLVGPTFNVVGAGSTGLVVEGGAAARVTDLAEFNLNGLNTVGILIDGEKHDLAGNVQGIAPSRVVAQVKYE